MEITWLMVDQAGTPVTGGAAATWLKVRRSADGYLLDWSDYTFKASGWTTPAITFEEIDATNLPGYYRRVMDISAWNDGLYQLIAGYVTDDMVARGDSDLWVKSGAEASGLSVGELLVGDLGDGVSFPAGSLADLIRKLFWMMCGRLVITEASGAFTAFKTDGVTPAASGSITDNGTATERSAPTWP
jgi:hypothetical protein